jgi:hypothetical protein
MTENVIRRWRLIKNYNKKIYKSQIITKELLNNIIKKIFKSRDCNNRSNHMKKNKNNLLKKFKDLKTQLSYMRKN